MDIGPVGLVVMGQNLALNIADHGCISVTTERPRRPMLSFRKTKTLLWLFGAQWIEEFAQ